MHDIGQLSLADPIPGGATVPPRLSSGDGSPQLGAEVIR